MTEVREKATGRKGYQCLTMLTETMTTMTSR